VKQRVHLVLGVLLVAALGWATWQALRQQRKTEPVYEGKPLSYWIYRPLTRWAHSASAENFWRFRDINYMVTDYTIYTAGPARNRWPEDICGPLATSLSDTNAIPFLIRELSRGVDNWRGGKYYRQWLWPKLPEPVRRHLPIPYYNQHGQINAVILLGQMRSAAKASVPALTGVLKKEKSPVVRDWAAAALGRLGEGDRLAVAALTEALKDANPSVRGHATNALLTIDPEAAMREGVKLDGLLRKLAVQAAVEALGKDGSTIVRQDAAAVAALAGALDDRARLVRQATSNTLWRIDPENAAKAGIGGSRP
jgi:hypothetical protein